MGNRARIAAVLVLVAVGAGLGFTWPWGRGVKVLKLPGTVEVHEVRLGPRVAGRVAKVFVTEGQTVARGDALVELAVPELLSRLDALKARAEQAAADLKKTRDGARPEELGADEAVRAAKARYEKLNNGYRKEEKRQARSELEVARADLRLAQEEHERASRLTRDRASARADFDTARAALDRARGRLVMAEAKSEMMEAGSRVEEIEEARAEFRRLEHARDLLRATRPSDIEAARAREAEALAALREAEINLAEAVVRAEETCVVELVAVRPGDLVVAGQPVARALRTGDLWVKTYVPETELGRLRLNQDVEVSVDSAPDRRLPGRIVHIGAESEYTPRNVQTVDERKHQMFGIRVKVSDPEGRFKSGMAAEVFIPIKD